MQNLKMKGLFLTVLILILFLSPLLLLEAQAKAEGSKVNINTASQTELQQLPRIGPKIAQRIIDYRKEHGNFKKVEELLKVKGIGEKLFSQLKDRITVGTESQAK